MRVVLGLLLCCLAWAASADSWMPPSEKTYLSPDGRTRIVVTPRGLESQLAYFRDKVADKRKAGQAPGAEEQAMAEIQVRDGGRWRPVRAFPLVNDVAPTRALVADGARRIVTFDNWHSVGHGPDTVVVYDATGRVVRSMGLEDFLPAGWIRHLPRSVSSLWWSGEHAIDPAGKVLTLQVMFPGESDFSSEPPTVPVRISAEDGRVLEQDPATWDPAIRRVAELEAERSAQWARLRAARAKPLPFPQGTDAKVWRAYIVELRERLSDYDRRVGYCGIALLENADGYTDADSMASWIERMANPEFGVDERCVFASPDPRRLARVIAKALEANPPDSMRDDTIVFVGDQADFALIGPAAKRSGVGLRFIDAAVPFAGKLMPEAVPDWFDGPTR